MTADRDQEERTCEGVLILPDGQRVPADIFEFHAEVDHRPVQHRDDAGRPVPPPGDWQEWEVDPDSRRFTVRVKVSQPIDAEAKDAIVTGPLQLDVLLDPDHPLPLQGGCLFWDDHQEGAPGFTRSLSFCFGGRDRSPAP